MAKVLTAGQLAAIEAAEAAEELAAGAAGELVAPAPARVAAPSPAPASPEESDADLLVGMAIATPAIYPHVSFVRPFDFASAFHQSAWAALVRIVQSGVAPTPSEVASLGADLDVGRLVALAGRAPRNPEAAKAAATRLADARRGREAASLFAKAARRIGEATRGESRDDATWQGVTNETLNEVVRLTASRDTRHASVVEAAARQRIVAGRARVATGIPRLDAFLDGGLLGSTMTAICAAPKVGKTALAATISYNMEESGTPHLFVSLERHDSDVEDLKLGRLCKVRASRLTAEVLGRSPGFPFRRTCEYMHRPGATIEDVAAEIRHQVWINGARAALVDFYQLIGGRQRNERDDAHMARVAQTLQRVAVETAIPLVVFVQLDEMGYPTMNREAMRQAANTYLVLHRDPQDPRAFLETQANNVGEGHDVGSITQKSLHLEFDEGPHFRDAHAVQS